MKKLKTFQKKFVGKSTIGKINLGKNLIDKNINTKINALLQNPSFKENICNIRKSQGIPREGFPSYPEKSIVSTSKGGEEIENFVEDYDFPYYHKYKKDLIMLMADYYFTADWFETFDQIVVANNYFQLFNGKTIHVVNVDSDEFKEISKINKIAILVNNETSREEIADYFSNTKIDLIKAKGRPNNTITDKTLKLQKEITDFMYENEISDFSLKNKKMISKYLREKYGIKMNSNKYDLDDLKDILKPIKNSLLNL